MSFRSLLLFICCLPVSAFAQRAVTFGPFIAFGTGGVQETLEVSEQKTFAQGIRLAAAYQLGIAVDWGLGGGRSLGAEVAWLQSETRIVERFVTQVRTGGRVDFDRTLQQNRFTGGQFQLLFRQGLVTERTITPLLELGVGAFFPAKIQQRFSRTNQPENEWHDLSRDRVGSVLIQPMAGFGINWGPHCSITLRLTVSMGKILESNDFFCVDFCPFVSPRDRMGVGLNTQMLRIGYLF